MQVAFLITILTLFIVVLVYKNEKKKKISRIEGNRESGAGRGHHKKKKIKIQML